MQVMQLEGGCHDVKDAMAWVMGSKKKKKKKCKRTRKRERR